MPSFGKLTLSEYERTTGKLFVKSDIYEAPGGYSWTAEHPSGWRAIGKNTTVDECHAEIERLYREALEGDAQVEGGRVILRWVEDHDEGSEVEWWTLTDDELDDVVDFWHDGAAPDKTLAEFLGMTDEEYGLWVTDPTAAKRLRTHPAEPGQN